MNRSQVVHYLVENGADIEIANRHGHTCLMIAAYKGHEDIVQFLLERGAHIDRRSKKGARLALSVLPAWTPPAAATLCHTTLTHYTLYTVYTLPPTLLDKQYPHITLHDFTYFMSLCRKSLRECHLSISVRTVSLLLRIRLHKYCICIVLYNKFTVNGSRITCDESMASQGILRCTTRRRPATCRYSSSSSAAARGCSLIYMAPLLF